MYGYIVCTFKHIDDTLKRQAVQQQILQYVQHTSKSSKKYIVEEQGESGDNPHWNIFLEHKHPAHLLDIFKGYYTNDYYTPGVTVRTQRVKSDTDAAFIIKGYLTKEISHKVIYDSLSEDYKKQLSRLYEVHDHQVTPKDKVIRRFCRLSDSEFINVLYDAFYGMYESTLDEGSDFMITHDEFKRVVVKVGKDYNIQQHLNKLSSFYLQIKMMYGICNYSDLDV